MIRQISARPWFNWPALWRSPRAAAGTSTATTQALDEQATALAQAALMHFMDLADEPAAEIAAASQKQLGQWLGQCLGHGRDKGLTAASPAVDADQARHGLQEAMAHSPCLLALPFSLPALQWLATLRLPAGTPALRIQDPGAPPWARALGAQAGAAQVCAPADAVRQVKTAAAGRPRLVISFPALHAPGHDTTTAGQMLGKACRLSLLEPLLCRAGGLSLLTLAPRADGMFELQCLPAPDAQQPRRMGDTLAWLASHHQAAVSAAPAQHLAWPQLYRASAPFQAMARCNRIKQLDAYLSAWQASGAGMPPEGFARARARLAELRIQAAGAPA